MSRYTGPKARINRRLSAMIFESAGAAKAFDRRPNAPGMAPPVRKISTYGESMREKQKIKYYYGLGERQLRRIFEQSKHAEGDTGSQMLTLCERRLDSVVRLAGFTKTRPQARQGVCHGHFTLNGRHCDIASLTVRPGDVIHVKRRGSLTDLYGGNLASFDGTIADWLSIDTERLTITVSRLPGPEDVTLPVNVQVVVELLSR